MANKKTVKVVTFWTDAAGNIARYSFNCEMKGGEAATLDISEEVTAVQAIVDKIEAASDCKYLGCAVVCPVTLSLTTPKTDPASGGRARRHATSYWNGTAGDNARTEIASTHVPDPTDAATDNSGTRPALKTDETNVAALITAYKAKACTVGGDTIASYKGSIIRQRVVNKRSKQ